MLDRRFLWDDSSPTLLCCSRGLRKIVLQASVVHHLPVVSNDELYALLRATHLYTETGSHVMQGNGHNNWEGKFYDDTTQGPRRLR